MPTTGQTRTVSGKTEWWWNGNWHTVPPSSAPSGGRAPAPTGATGGQLSPAASGGTVAPVGGGGGDTADPGPTAPPFDASYQNRLDLIRRNLADILAGLDVQQGTTIKRFGLDDNSDPYALAALLKKSFGERVAGSTNSYASQGQLYAGSLVNAQNANRSNYDQGYDSLRKQQADILANIAAKRAQAQRDAQTGILDATDSYTQNALSNLPTGDQVPLAQNSLAPRMPSVPRLPSTRRRRTTTGGRLYGGTLATGGRY